MPARLRSRAIATFLAISFGACWALAGLVAAAGWSWSGATAVIVGVLYMFGPALGAVVVHRHVLHEPVRTSLELRWGRTRWMFIALLVPVLLAVASMCVSLLLPEVSFDPSMGGIVAMLDGMLPPEQIAEAKAELDALPIPPVALYLLSIPQALIAGATINALAAFGEELGWRGFLQRELAPLGFWRSSFAVGAIWGVWHAPLILMGHNYPADPPRGVLWMVAFCVLYAPILAWLRQKAGSVFAAAWAHGAINASAGLSFMLLSVVDPFRTGITGVAGFAVLAVVNVLILVLDRPVVGEGAVVAAR